MHPHHSKIEIDYKNNTDLIFKGRRKGERDGGSREGGREEGNYRHKTHREKIPGVQV